MKNQQAYIYRLLTTTCVILSMLCCIVTLGNAQKSHKNKSSHTPRKHNKTTISVTPNNTNFEHFISIAESALVKQDYTKALDAAQSAIKKNPKRYEGYRCCAKAAFFLEDPNTGEDYLKQAMQYATETQKQSLQRGFADISHLRESLALRDEGKRLASADKNAEAAVKLSKAFELYPQKPTIGMEAGDLFERAGNLDDAIKVVQAVAAQATAGDMQNAANSKINELKEKVEQISLRKQQEAERLALQKQQEVERIAVQRQELEQQQTKSIINLLNQQDEISTVMKMLETLRQEETQAKSQVAQISDDLTKNKATRDDLRQEIVSCESSMKTYQKLANDSDREAERYESDAAKYRMSNNPFDAVNVIFLEKIARENRGDARKFRSIAEDRESERDKSKDKLKDVGDEISDLERQKNNTRIKLDSTRNSIESIEQQVEKGKKNLERLMSELERIKEKLSKLSSAGM